MGESNGARASARGTPVVRRQQQHLWPRESDCAKSVALLFANAAVRMEQQTQKSAHERKRVLLEIICVRDSSECGSRACKGAWQLQASPRTLAALTAPTISVTQCLRECLWRELASDRDRSSVQQTTIAQQYYSRAVQASFAFVDHWNECCGSKVSWPRDFVSVRSHWANTSS